MLGAAPVSFWGARRTPLPGSLSAKGEVRPMGKKQKKKRQPGLWLTLILKLVIRWPKWPR